MSLGEKGNRVNAAKTLLAKVQTFSLLSVSPTNQLLFRYLLVGATAALVDWFFYWLFINTILMHYIVSATISFILATSVNFILSKKWVFRNTGRFGRLTEYGLVFVVSAVGLIINQVVLLFLIERFTLHYMLSKVAATGMVFFWNYYLRKNIIFKN